MPDIAASQAAGFRFETTVARDHVQAQVERILGSATFSRSRRLGRFLSFIVAQSLAGNAANLKEYLLGVEIFDKGEAFDPRMDSIVRVEARRLRSKLRLYYHTEGCDDQVLIELPKGSYIPVVMHRSEAGRGDNMQRAGVLRTVIAVAPLTNLSGYASVENFCAGLQEDLIAAICGGDGYQAAVAPRPGVVSGTEPGVRNVNLEGAVRMGVDHIRVSMKAVDPEAGLYLWCQNYDCRLKEFLELQEDLARVIVDDLRKALEANPSPPA